MQSLFLSGLEDVDVKIRDAIIGVVGVGGSFFLSLSGPPLAFIYVGDRHLPSTYPSRSSSCNVASKIVFIDEFV